MKYSAILITCFSFVAFFSCQKGKPNSYKRKILGTWTRDSIVEFQPNNQDSLVYISTNTVPKMYNFKKHSKTKGKEMIQWNGCEVNGTDLPRDILEMNESVGSMYLPGTLGDLGDTWYITAIDKNTCCLRLDYRGGLGSYITNQYWYYLSR